MPKKPPKPNAYSMFVQEFKERQGRKFNSTADAFAAAAPHWANMSREQKRPYEERARKLKENWNPVKYTSEGIAVDDILQEEKMKHEFMENMKHEITHTIKLAERNGRLDEEMFFLIHINIFFETTQKVFYPAEIAVAGFSLKDGISDENVFHRMIFPGKLPLGSALGVKQNCDVHKIDPPPLSGNEDNQLEVFEEMIQFLKSRMVGSSRLPPLYTPEEYRDRVQIIAQQWERRAGWEPTLVVYNLQPMFRILRNAVAGEQVWPSETFSSRELEKDVNAYAPDIACEYHELGSAVPYCSRSAVCRYAYTICDNCSPHLSINLVPGAHVPHTAFVRQAFSDTASTWSGPSKRSLKAESEDTESNYTSSWETDSVASEASSATLNSNANFPPLGGKRSGNATPASFKNFTPQDASSTISSWSSKGSSAGLSTRPAALPTQFDRSMKDLSLSDDKNFPSLECRGRGRRRGDDSSSRPGI